MYLQITTTMNVCDGERERERQKIQTSSHSHRKNSFDVKEHQHSIDNVLYKIHIFSLGYA